MTQALADAALAYVGTRFLAGGRSRHGMDCSGLVLASAWDCGIPLPPFTGFRPGGCRSAQAIAAALERYCAPAEGPESTPGLIVGVQILSYPRPRHLAITTGAGMAVHAAEGFRVMEVPLNGLGGKILGAWKLKAWPPLH